MVGPSDQSHLSLPYLYLRITRPPLSPPPFIAVTPSPSLPVPALCLCGRPSYTPEDHSPTHMSFHLLGLLRHLLFFYNFFFIKIMPQITAKALEFPCKYLDFTQKRNKCQLSKKINKNVLLSLVCTCFAMGCTCYGVRAEVRGQL